MTTLFSRSHSRDRWGSRGRTSWERDHDSYELPEYRPPVVMRDVTRHPVMSPGPNMHLAPRRSPEPDLEDIDVNVVSVLRLLTALEDKLGSLGPKVIDLLAQALAMEKNEANRSVNNKLALV